MFRKANQLPTIFLALLCYPPASGLAQTHQDETNSQVPALVAFHEVIYVLWHDAWPSKDLDRLKALVPDIEKHVNALNQAKLPGILRDKRDKWQAGLAELQAIFADYKKAAAASEAQALLDAAEKLHAQYERMVRIIRPALKEVDSFHASLYMLYHHYLPQFDLTRIKTSAAELKAKMGPLGAASLPPRLKAKETAFAVERTKLSAAVDRLAEVAAAGDRKQIETAVETLHSAYQALVASLE
jgi:hypothetical protein